ncbi:acyl carrier protein [Myxacorys almedinensis A]|uniref:Acyl carrier protein n=1 Tax=Myxacorys almedinensis A TaxID=2690445 RepID=A0A8J7Z3W6_9CYAN|nr:acyl carrier protein [Myxacorys almedinensis A]
MKYQVAADKERLAEKARRRDALKADIPARVQKIVIEQLQVDKNRVDLDSSLANDLGMDELDRVELLMALEEEFDIEIPDDVAEDGWDTVKDLVNLVQERLLD